MKILFGNMNVCAANTALKVFPEIFQIVDVRIADNLFMDAVIYGPVASEVEFNALQ
jgi:hypothetical protein